MICWPGVGLSRAPVATKLEFLLRAIRSLVDSDHPVLVLAADDEPGVLDAVPRPAVDPGLALSVPAWRSEDLDYLVSLDFRQAICALRFPCVAVIAKMLGGVESYLKEKRRRGRIAGDVRAGAGDQAAALSGPAYRTDVQVPDP